MIISKSIKDVKNQMMISTNKERVLNNRTNRSDIFSINWNNLCSRHAIIILLDQIFAVTLVDGVLISRILLFLFYWSIINRYLYCLRMVEYDTMVQIFSLLCICGVLNYEKAFVCVCMRNPAELEVAIIWYWKNDWMWILWMKR